MSTVIFPNRLPPVKEKSLLNFFGCCLPRFRIRSLAGLLCRIDYGAGCKDASGFAWQSPPSTRFSLLKLSNFSEGNWGPERP